MLEKIVWGLFYKLPESWRNHEGTMKEPWRNHEGCLRDIYVLMNLQAQLPLRVGLYVIDN
jgi:hypothetical protein